jgi:hypothetical protein
LLRDPEDCATGSGTFCQLMEQQQATIQTEPRDVRRFMLSANPIAKPSMMRPALHIKRVGAAKLCRRADSVEGISVPEKHRECSIRK